MVELPPERNLADLEAMARLHEVGNWCIRAGAKVSYALDEVLAAAIAFTGADKGNIQLFDPASDALVIVAHRGFNESFLRFFASVHDENAACAVAMHSAQRVIVEDVTRSEIFSGKSSLQVLLDAGVRAVQSTPLVSSAGEVLGMISTHFSVPHHPGERALRFMDLLARQTADYLERTRAEEALRANEKELETIISGTPFMLTRCSRDLRYRFVSRAYANMLGCEPSEIAGRPIAEIMGEDGLNAIRQHIGRVLQGHRVEYESPVPFQDIGIRHLHVVYTPETEDGGHVTGWIASIVDVTERKRAEEALRRADRLAGAGRMAATVAHEINNPLSSVVNCLYLLGSEVLPPKAREYFDIAMRELERVGRITKQTLSFYRTSDQHEKFNVCDIAGEVVGFFQPIAARQHVRLEYRGANGHLTMGNPAEIRQLLTNLLTNALESGGTAVRVRIYESLRRNHSEQLGVRISVSDNGKGIAPEHLRQVFEPFFTTKGEKGTGLGLWVAHGIVTKHEGEIRARSSVRNGSNGTCVSIFLPTIESAARAQAAS